MFDFHCDKKEYFEIQYKTACDSIVPLVSQYLQITEHTRVLELGSAEAGVLKAFTERGCHCTGIELSPGRVELACKFMQQELAEGRVQFLSKNIYDVIVEKDIGFKFDLIILKDVIEHIHEQEKFIPYMMRFLNPNGLIFIGFPPWTMPYGGHQQMCANKFLSRLPYFHLLPVSIYRRIIQFGKEKPNKIEMLLEVKQTGITINRFEKIISNNRLKIINRILYIIPPVYRYKFKLKPRRLCALFTKIPIFRDFCTMSAYYVIQKE